MKKNKMNKYMIWGILISSIVRIAKVFIEIPDALVCFGVGLGFSLLLLGLYTINHDMTRVKGFKRNIVKRFIRAK